MMDCFRDTTGIAGDHNLPAGHRLQNRIRQTVPDRRLQDDIAEVQMICHIGWIVKVSGHDNPVGGFRTFYGECREMRSFAGPNHADHQQAAGS